MHMTDALLSPAVGGIFWTASAGTIFYCAARVGRETEDRRVPLMGVLGAFIFAMQMLNFAIPGTGSSGHLAGGMLLAILLGPHAAFLTLASVLTVQALFFADGGLLALGSNMFNLGFLPCFVAYPIFFGRQGERAIGRTLTVTAILAAVAAMQLGALAVVMQTVLSGISELPFRSFLLMMLPIHLVIGVIEGVVTAAVVAFLWRAAPEMISSTPETGSSRHKWRWLLAGILGAALLAGGALSWFSSADPDGLEWSIARVAGKEDISLPAGEVHAVLGALQERLSFLPDYGFPPSERGGDAAAAEEIWPAIDGGTSTAGLAGGLMTMALLILAGMLLKRFSSPTSES